MCIICNVSAGDDVSAIMSNVEKANHFLDSFDRSRLMMKEAADAMLEVSRIAPGVGDRKRYDQIHKQMVRQLREWNKLEQSREHGSATQGG